MTNTVEHAANEYVRLLSAAGERWSLHAMGDLSDDYEKGKLIASLAALGNPVQVEEIEREFGIERLKGRDAMVQLGRILMASLVQDVGECLSLGERETFRKCHFCMIDIGEINALCADRDIVGQELPGYVIIVNQGLYFCIKLLVTAQIYEDMQGDFLKYRRSGGEVFSAACDLFLAQRPDSLNVGAVFTGNEQVDGAIEAHVSLGSTLMMQFVMLHELGHAHLRHGALLGRGRLSALAAAHEDKPPEHAVSFHRAELDADRFAWNALARRADTEMKNFANLYVIRLFFGFLACLERILGRSLSGDHPPPNDRVANLTSAFAPDGLSAEQEDLFRRQDALILDWSQCTAMGKINER